MLSSGRPAFVARDCSGFAPPMFYPLFRPLLFALDPETAHELAFASLDAAVVLVRGTKKGIAMTTDCNSRYVFEPAEVAVPE